MSEPSHEAERRPTTRMPRLAHDRVQLAIDAGQIYCVYQPIVEIETGRAFGYEALARCEVSELASPLQLLQAAAHEGILGVLGREIRRAAVATASRQRLFLNIHPDEFDDAALARPDDPMHQCQEAFVEITESSPLTSYRFSRAVLDELRGRGVKLAVDDFGSGYANPTYLADLAPDVVKLDRELIAGVRVGTRRHVLLRSLVGMCEAQGATVVAEGVETEGELEAVRCVGVTLAQGFLFGRPNRMPLPPRMP